MNVTPEVIEALAWLRNGWDGDNSEQAITCLDVLDNAGVFAEIDEATGYEVDPVCGQTDGYGKACLRSPKHRGLHSGSRS